MYLCRILKIHKDKYLLASPLDPVYKCIFLFEFPIYLFSAENFNGSDDIQDNAVMGLAYSTFQRILGNSPQVLNPIDRLYSMQNYYFRCNNRQPNDCDDNDAI